jgi:hypothetical protein
MKRRQPTHLRVVDDDERGTGYLVRKIAERGIGPHDLYRLEQSLWLTPVAAYAAIRKHIGIEEAFRFLDAGIGTGWVRADVTRSDQTVYAVRSAALAPNFELIDPASIEYALEMAGLTKGDFPPAQEEPFWILIFKPIDKNARARVIHELRLETDPTYYEHEKARNER